VLAHQLFEINITVRICNEPKVSWLANYGSERLTLNLGRLGRRWFEALASEEMNELLLHEFAHQYAMNHLSDEYHEALCQLGARLGSVALKSPEVFDPARYADPV
jgi:hypothetical protein